MSAGQLIVLRHGRTPWNSAGRFQGQADIGLDELGHEQAARVAPLLAELAPSAIVASDLSRATQTAAPLAALCELPVRTDVRLREIHVGSWEGLTIEQMLEQAEPEIARRYLAGEDVRRSETGETVAEVADRVAEALGEIAARADDGTTVVVVMHGLAARVGVCRFVGLPEPHWTALGSLDNTGWIALSPHRSGGFWRITAYNALAPLEQDVPAGTSAGWTGTLLRASGRSGRGLVWTTKRRRHAFSSSERGRKTRASRPDRARGGRHSNDFASVVITC